MNAITAQRNGSGIWATVVQRWRRLAWLVLPQVNASDVSVCLRHALHRDIERIEGLAPLTTRFVAFSFEPVEFLKERCCLLRLAQLREDPR